MRNLIVCALTLAGVGMAHADLAPPRVAPSQKTPVGKPMVDTHGFTKWVTDEAKARDLRVSTWWLVYLDQSLFPAMAAVLCDKKGGDFADLFVEHEKRRWNLVFYTDGRSSPGCGAELSVNLEQEKPVTPRGITLRTGHRGGYQDKRIGLRGGELVVVYEESLDDAREGDSPKKVDWDKKVKAKKGTYPALATGAEPGYGEVMIRPAAK